MTTLTYLLLPLFLAAALSSSSAFQVRPSVPVTTIRHASPSTSRLLAGFGNSDKKKKKPSSSGNKAKPKQQWDRFLDMKTRPKIPVGVKVAGGDEWLSVGHVRSSQDDNLPLAIARQRAMIAEHAHRLYPLQVSVRQTVDWGYQEGEEWTALEKDVLSSSDVNDNKLDKTIGFAGTADEASGYYCIYDGGKVQKATK